MKYGPDRPELRFRLWFSVVGLVLVGIALYVRGIPETPAGWEGIALGVVFFGGTFVWTLWKLLKRGG